jgi:hypothetical protein
MSPETMFSTDRHSQPPSALSDCAVRAFLPCFPLQYLDTVKSSPEGARDIYTSATRYKVTIAYTVAV